MNNKYNRVVLDGGNNFDLEGVRFSGKSFIFWKKKTTKEITEVAVIFDRKYENIQVHDRVAILSLKGLTNYNDLSEAISIFREITQYKQFQFYFIVGNENERILAEALGKNLGLTYFIKNMNQNIQKDIEQQQKTMIEELKKQKDLSVSGNQMIEKYDNGTFKQITLNNGVAYENNGILNSEEEKMSLLKEWTKAPEKVDELSKLSKIEKNEMLNNTVMSNRRGYHLESSREQVATNPKEATAIVKAREENGLVNTQLGIIQNNISSQTRYSAVEQQGDRIQVVNPNVVDTNIYSNNGIVNSNGVSETVSNFNSYDNTTDFNASYETEYASDYKEMRQNNSSVYSNSNVYMKPKVRTLKPSRDRRAAFVSLPVIIFILSALLLIISAVLLFVVD